MRRGSLAEIRARVAERDALVVRLVVDERLPIAQVTERLGVSDETLRQSLQRQGCVPVRRPGVRGWYRPPAGDRVVRGVSPSALPVAPVPAAPVPAPTPPPALGSPGRPALPGLPALPGQPGQREPVCCTLVKAVMAQHLAEITTHLVGGLEQQLALLTGRPPGADPHPLFEGFVAQAQAAAQEEVAQQVEAERLALGDQRARASGAARKTAADARAALAAAARRHAQLLAATRAEGRRRVQQVGADLRIQTERAACLEDRVQWLGLQLAHVQEERDTLARRQPDRLAQGAPVRSVVEEVAHRAQQAKTNGHAPGRMTVSS